MKEFYLFGQMVGRHKYQMIQTQQPHGQERDQQQQHETTRNNTKQHETTRNNTKQHETTRNNTKQHETTIHRDMQEGGWGQADDDERRMTNDE